MCKTPNNLQNIRFVLTANQAYHTQLFNSCIRNCVSFRESRGYFVNNKAINSSFPQHKIYIAMLICAKFIEDIFSTKESKVHKELPTKFITLKLQIEFVCNHLNTSPKLFLETANFLWFFLASFSKV